MGQWTDQRIFANDINIHYSRTGGEKPTLLLLHGFIDNGLCWTPVAKALEQDYDVIMPDARGHGLSDGPEHGFSTELLVADAAAVIQGLGLQKPYVLGHSMGAHTAATMARQHPQLVRALLLEDPPWLSTDTPAQSSENEQALRGWEAHIRSLQAEPFAERLADAHAEHPRWSYDEACAWAEAQGQFDLTVFHRGFVNVSRDWHAIVTQLACSTLLIAGDPARGAIVTPEVAQLALSTWSDGRLATIAGAGHSIRRDQFDQFTKTVRQFLAEK